MSILPDDGTARKILAAVRELDCDADDGAIAGWCGVCDSLVAHWRSGARSMPAWAVKRILKRLPPESAAVVADEILRPAGLRAEQRDPSLRAGRALPEALEASVLYAQIVQAIAAGEADNIWSEEEIEAVQALRRQFEAANARAISRVRPGRVA